MGEAVTSGPGGTIHQSGISSFALGYANGAGSAAIYGNRQWFFCHGYANAGILQATATPSFAIGQNVQATATNTFALGSSVILNGYGKFFHGWI